MQDTEATEATFRSVSSFQTPYLIVMTLMIKTSLKSTRHILIRSLAGVETV